MSMTNCKVSMNPNGLELIAAELSVGFARHFAERGGKPKTRGEEIAEKIFAERHDAGLIPEFTATAWKLEFAHAIDAARAEERERMADRVIRRLESRADQLGRLASDARTKVGGNIYDATQDGINEAIAIVREEA